MFSRTARRAAVALALITAGLALTACGPNDPSSASSSSTSAGTAAGSSATTSGGGAAGGSATASSGSGGTDDKSATAGSGSTLPACATGDLKVTAEAQDSGAGHTMYQLVFQNTGSKTCTLQGYPGVSFVKADDTQLGKAAARTSGSSSTGVTLIQNAHAYADLQTVDGPGGYTTEECDLTDVPDLKVYPPNQTASVDIPWNHQECVGSGIQNLQVGPVHGNK